MNRPLDRGFGVQQPSGVDVPGGSDRVETSLSRLRNGKRRRIALLPVVRDRPQFRDPHPLWRTRRIVIVLVRDIAGTTALSQTIDTESLRQPMARYFDEMRASSHDTGGSRRDSLGTRPLPSSVFNTCTRTIPFVRVRAAVEMRSRSSSSQ
jgi:class 3 adenylate cyclase